MLLRDKILRVFEQAQGALSMMDIARACSEHNRTSVQRVVRELCLQGELCAFGENTSRVYRRAASGPSPLATQLVRITDEEALASAPLEHTGRPDKRGLVAQLTRLLRAEVELRKKIQEITDRLAAD